MAQPSPVPVPLEQTREHVIQQLSEHFAYDNLSIEALEERLDRAHLAASPDELRALVADLPVIAADATPAPTTLEVLPDPIPLVVLFEDADLIVVDKPAGLVVHPAAGHATGTLVNALLHHCKDLSGIGGVLRPGIVHVGVGNFHRAHQAVYLDELFAQGRGHDFGIVGAGIRDADRAMRAALAKQDWLTTVVEQDGGQTHARVTASMTGFVDPADPRALVEAMADPATSIVSLTVTEGGYCVDAATGRFDAAHPDIVADAASAREPRSERIGTCSPPSRTSGASSERSRTSIAIR
jgi:hypothetical protein